MINLTNHIAGYDVPLTKTNIGQLVIPSEVLKKHPELKRYENTIRAPTLLYSPNNLQTLLLDVQKIIILFQSNKRHGLQRSRIQLHKFKLPLGNL